MKCYVWSKISMLSNASHQCYRRTALLSLNAERLARAITVDVTRFISPLGILLPIPTVRELFVIRIL